MPSIKDFCDKNEIMWFPIDLQIVPDKIDPNKKEKVLQPIKNKCYAHDKINKKGETYISYKAEPTDFKTLSVDIIKQRQEFLSISDWIAIDTRFIHQIDIDYIETIEVYNDILKDAPYFKSATKGFPHIFIKQDGFIPKSDRIQLKNGGLEPNTDNKCDEGV